MIPPDKQQCVALPGNHIKSCKGRRFRLVFARLTLFGIVFHASKHDGQTRSYTTSAGDGTRWCRKSAAIEAESEERRGSDGTRLKSALETPFPILLQPTPGILLRSDPECICTITGASANI